MQVSRASAERLTIEHMFDYTPNLFHRGARGARRKYHLLAGSRLVPPRRGFSPLPGY